MGQYLEMMVAASRRARVLAEKLLVGVGPEIAARKPRFERRGETVTIDTNHPVWVFGHLGLYPARIAALVGLDGAALNPPAAWEGLFKNGTVCQDDAMGTVYPKIGEITAHYFRASDAMLEMLAGVDDATLLLPTPTENYKKSFPIAGQAVTFMLTSHIMMHMGQISAWRRCFGLPSAV